MERELRKVQFNLVDDKCKNYTIGDIEYDDE